MSSSVAIIKFKKILGIYSSQSVSYNEIGN